MLQLRAHGSGARLQPPIASTGSGVGCICAPNPYALAEQCEFLATNAEADADTRLQQVRERANFLAPRLQIGAGNTEPHRYAARRKFSQDRIDRRTKTKRFAFDIDPRAAPSPRYERGLGGERAAFVRSERAEIRRGGETQNRIAALAPIAIVEIERIVDPCIFCVKRPAAFADAHPGCAQTQQRAFVFGGRTRRSKGRPCEGDRDLGTAPRGGDEGLFNRPGREGVGGEIDMPRPLQRR